ncbi:hypothetical protein [Amycolatopsis keratiniphila]|uniref:hypothetical protein n=1 Tax=Amycolatopsis keratiniphila TaxID=129921 RepID=UPI00087B84FE|nr:hypothetical protein [Amycolatopsis keratiniphila]OLZ48024.1 hypothetical protein BS330_34020 [Amycolatopsis keratiniphila subsp. nogabecina]SDU27697.1 hypothetical protein SAMN04489733_2638 [Amycolatopsis keratiniphila]
MTDRLGQKQTAAMLALMVVAREVSNPELREIVGFALDGKERRQLNGLDLVASEQRGRPFYHELTERGWAWCEEELSQEEAPLPRSSLGSALYVVLGGLGRHLRREKLRLADLFMPEVDLTVEEIESRIRIAYRKLSRSPRDWVSLVELRPMLGEASAVDVDAVLKELSRSGQAHLVPESNRKALTAADHAAAIRIGGEDNHLISIEAP